MRTTFKENSILQHKRTLTKMMPVGKQLPLKSDMADNSTKGRQFSQQTADKYNGARKIRSRRARNDAGRWAIAYLRTAATAGMSNRRAALRGSQTAARSAHAADQNRNHRRGAA
jgi:hypothetical protein